MVTVHIGDQTRYKNAVEALPDTREIDVEFRVALDNGQIRHLREIGVVTTDESGIGKGSFGVIEDLTNRVEHQREVAYRDALAQQAEAITDIGHFIYDELAEVYVYISPGFARIHGVSVEEYMQSVSSRSDDISDICEEDRERVAEVYQQHLRDTKNYSVEYRIRRADGAIRWIRELCTAHWVNYGLVEQSLGVLQDITEQKESEDQLLEAKLVLEEMVKTRTEELASMVTQLKQEVQEREKIAAELEFLANHDALTGLPSLRLCKDRLEHSLAESRRNKQNSAVMFIDLDGFKEVNDTHGHEHGDLVLKVIADRVRAEIRETGTVARIGGDEFVIILSSVPELEIVERIASEVIEQISLPIEVDQQEVVVSASIGVSIYPEDGETPEELIRQADRAMYLVKDSGKNNFGFTLPAPLN